MLFVVPSSVFRRAGATGYASALGEDAGGSTGKASGTRPWKH